MTGLFNLKTPQDLLEKLKREFELLKADPLNVDHAFNFFVTAEHLPEWVYPNDQSRQSAKRKLPLLAVCSHIANGAKHFETSDKRHKSVQNAEMRMVGGLPGFQNNFHILNGPNNYVLMVTLTNAAASYFKCSCIPATELAEKLLDYWTKEIPP